jgi:hypothetical protein
LLNRIFYGEPVSTSPENALAHDPEKWEPVFGKDHAQCKKRTSIAVELIVLASGTANHDRHNL